MIPRPKSGVGFSLLLNGFRVEPSARRIEVVKLKDLCRSGQPNQDMKEFFGERFLVQNDFLLGKQKKENRKYCTSLYFFPAVLTDEKFFLQLGEK